MITWCHHDAIITSTLKCFHTHTHTLCCSRVMWGNINNACECMAAAVIWQELWYILDNSPLHQEMKYRDKQSHTFHINLESPVYPTCMSLDCGRKPKTGAKVENKRKVQPNHLNQRKTHGKPEQTQQQHTNHTDRPWPNRESNPGPSCCKATALFILLLSLFLVVVVAVLVKAPHFISLRIACPAHIPKNWIASWFTRAMTFLPLP